jgi:hypothetical protein
VLFFLFLSEYIGRTANCVLGFTQHAICGLLLNSQAGSWLFWGNVQENGYLQQTQFVGACDGFGAALYLQFVKDLPVVPLDRIQGQKKLLADGAI